MSDVIEGNVTPAVCSAAVNAGGKLLKVVEMTHRLGTKAGDGEKKLELLPRHDDEAASSSQS